MPPCHVVLVVSSSTTPSHSNHASILPSQSTPRRLDASICPEQRYDPFGVVFEVRHDYCLFQPKRRERLQNPVETSASVTSLRHYRRRSSASGQFCWILLLFACCRNRSFVCARGLCRHDCAARGCPVRSRGFARHDLAISSTASFGVRPGASDRGPCRRPYGYLALAAFVWFSNSIQYIGDLKCSSAVLSPASLARSYIYLDSCNSSPQPRPSSSQHSTAHPAWRVPT